MLQAQWQDRRLHARIEIDTMIRCRHEPATTFEWVKLDNLSEHGALIWTQRTFAPGSHLLFIAEPDEPEQTPIEFEATVVRIEPRQQDSLYGYGCLINRHEPINFSDEYQYPHSLAAVAEA